MNNIRECGIQIQREFDVQGILHFISHPTINNCNVSRVDPALILLYDTKYENTWYNFPCLVIGPTFTVY